MGEKWPPLRVKAEACAGPEECLEWCGRGPVRVDLRVLQGLLERLPPGCVVLVEPRGCASGSSGSGASRRRL